jgi:hypothetical protein
MYFTEVDSCVHATLGIVPVNDPAMHRIDFTANKAKKLANLQYLLTTES